MASIGKSQKWTKDEILYRPNAVSFFIRLNSLLVWKITAHMKYDHDQQPNTSKTMEDLCHSSGLIMRAKLGLKYILNIYLYSVEAAIEDTVIWKVHLKTQAHIYNISNTHGQCPKTPLFSDAFSSLMM